MILEKYVYTLQIAHARPTKKNLIYTLSSESDSVILIELIASDLSISKSIVAPAHRNEMIKADNVAFVSFGLLSDAPTVAYISYCGFIMSSSAQNSAWAIYANIMLSIRNTALIEPILEDVTRIKVVAMRARRQNIISGSSLEKSNIDALVGCVFIRYAARPSLE